MSASSSLVLSFTTGIIKKLLKITRNKKKKPNKIVTLGVISQALIDLEMSHEEYKTIINK